MGRLARGVVADGANDGPREHDGNNRLVRKYVHGLKHRAKIKSQNDNAKSSEPRAASRPRARCVASAQHDTWTHGPSHSPGRFVPHNPRGQPRVRERPRPRRAITIVNNQSSIINGHATRRVDTEAGLYYYRARYYNPYIGRFLQTDPIGYEAGLNPYTYCRDNPPSLVDPFGLDPPHISVAFYDGADDPSGAYNRNAADDMDYMFDMSECPKGMKVTDWIRRRLMALKRDLSGKGISWDEVKSVYFFDHSTGDEPREVEALQFGDQWLWGKTRELQELSEMLDSALPSQAHIVFAGCYLGHPENWDLLEDLAEWSDRDVVGPYGLVHDVIYPTGQPKESCLRDPYTQIPIVDENGKIVDNYPDFFSSHGWYMAVHVYVEGPLERTDTIVIVPYSYNGFGNVVY